jgi:hypothetical protein
MQSVVLRCHSAGAVSSLLNGRWARLILEMVNNLVHKIVHANTLNHMQIYSSAASTTQKTTTKEKD